MKTFLIALFSFYITSVQGTEHTWSDNTSPCGETLQACIDDAISGDTIFIKSNDALSVNLNLYGDEKSLSIIGVDGYRPSIYSTGGIVMDVVDDITIQGITLRSGHISLRKPPSSSVVESSVVVKNNILVNHAAGSSVIISNEDDSSTLNFIIENNDIDFQVNNNVSIYVSAASGLSNNHVNGVIVGNKIQAKQNNRGILLSADNQGDFNVDVLSNTIHGASLGAISIVNEEDSGTLIANVKNNALLPSQSGGYNSGGIILVSEVGLPGSTAVNLSNNTILQSETAVNVWALNFESKLELGIFNNLVANNVTGIAFNYRENMLLTSNETNFFQGNDGYVNFNPTASTNVELGPEIDLIDTTGHLANDSPAIDAATFVDSYPFVDADGQYRLKGDEIDAGAFEKGIEIQNHRVSQEGFYISQVDFSAINAQSDLNDIHITPLLSLPGGITTHNYENIAIYYNVVSNRWSVFNEGLGELPIGSRFNILKTGSSTNTFEHTATGGSLPFTTINHEDLNDDPDKVILVTQNWIGIYNTHPVGIYYSNISGKWSIYNLDLEPLPNLSNFNVYFQDPSQTAWHHIATAENTHISKTYLDNPLLNGQECAQIQVTQDASNVFNDQPIAVEYDTTQEKWAIVNISPGLGASVIPEGAKFHVVIYPPQYQYCHDEIFKNGFDGATSVDL